MQKITMIIYRAQYKDMTKLHASKTIPATSMILKYKNFQMRKHKGERPRGLPTLHRIRSVQYGIFYPESAVCEERSYGGSTRN